MNSVEGQSPADENDGASANIQDAPLHGLPRTMGEVPGVKFNIEHGVNSSNIPATDAQEIRIIGHSVETTKQQDAKESTLIPLAPSLSISGSGLGLQVVGHGDRATYAKYESSTKDEEVYPTEPEDTASSAKVKCSMETGADTKAHSGNAALKLPEIAEKIDETSDIHREVLIREANKPHEDPGREEDNHVQAVSEPPSIPPPEPAIELKGSRKSWEQDHFLGRTEARDLRIASCRESASGEAKSSSAGCESNASDVASASPRRRPPSSVPAAADTALYEEQVEVVNSEEKDPSLSAGTPRGILKDKGVMDLREMEKETLVSGLGGSSSLAFPIPSSTGEDHSSEFDRSSAHAEHEVSGLRGEGTALKDAARSTAPPDKRLYADFTPDSVGLACATVAEKARGQASASPTAAIKNLATPAASPVEEASLDSAQSVVEVSTQVPETRPEAENTQESGGNVQGKGLVALKNVDEEEVCSFRIGGRQHGQLSEPNQIRGMTREPAGSAASASPGDAYAASKGSGREVDALTSEPVANEEGTNKIAAADLSMEEAEEWDDEEGDGDKVECVPFAHCCGELTVGDTVHVDSRTWPGINKHGGAARIRKIYEGAEGEGAEPNMLYDVSYLLGGSEKGIERRFIHSVNLRSDQAGPRARRKRVFFADEFADDYVPKKRPVEEWQQVVDVLENEEGSLLSETSAQNRKDGDSAGGKDKMRYRKKGMGEKDLESTKSLSKGKKRRRQQKRNRRKSSVNTANQRQVQKEALQGGEDEEGLPKGRARSNAKSGQSARVLDSDETEDSEESESTDDHEEDLAEDGEGEGGEMNKRSRAGKRGDRRGKHTDEGVTHDLQSPSRSDPWLDDGAEPPQIPSPSFDAYASSSASYSDAGGSLEEGEEEDSEAEDDDSLDDDNFIQPEDDASELPEDVQAKTGFRVAGSKEGLRRQLQQGQQNLLSLLDSARERQSRISKLMTRSSAPEDLDKAEKELLSLEVFHLHRMVRGGVDVVEAVLRKLSKRRCHLPERVELLFDRQEAEVMEQGRWIRRQKEELATLKARLGIPHIHFEADSEDLRENPQSKRGTERRSVDKKKSKRDKSGREAEGRRNEERKRKSDKSKRGRWSERGALSKENGIKAAVGGVGDGEEEDRVIFDLASSGSTCSDSSLGEEEEEEDDGDGEGEEILLDPFGDLPADKSVEGLRADAGLQDGVYARRRRAGSAQKTTGKKRSRKAMERSWLPFASVSSEARSRQHRTRPSRQGRERYNRERRGEPDPFLHRSLAENRGWARRAKERPRLLWPPPLHWHSVSSPKPSPSSSSTPSSTLLSTSRSDLGESFNSNHPPRETALERLWRQQDRRQRARAGTQRPSGPHAGVGVAVCEVVSGQRGTHPIQATGGESRERARRVSADADPLGLLTWPTLSQPKPFVAADVLPAPAASLVQAQARWRRVTEYWTLPRGFLSTAPPAVALPTAALPMAKTEKDSISSHTEEQDHTPAGIKDGLCQEENTFGGDADPSLPGKNNVEQQSHRASLEGKLHTEASSDTSSEPPWSELWGSLLEETLSRALRTGLRAISRRLLQLRRVSAGQRPSDDLDLVGQVEEILHVLYRRLDDSLKLLAAGDGVQVEQAKEKEECKTTDGLAQRTSQASVRTPLLAERISEADLAVTVWSEEVPGLLRALSSPRRIQSEMQTLPTNGAESIERDHLSRELVSTLRVLLWAFTSARRISRAGLCATLVSSESDSVSGGGRQGENKGGPCHPPDSADALLTLAAASATSLVELHMEGSGALRGALGEASSCAFGQSVGEEDDLLESLTPQRRLEQATEEAVLSLWLDLAEWSAGEWCGTTQVERAAYTGGASGGSVWLLLRWASPLLHASLCRRLSRYHQYENQTEVPSSEPVAEIWWLVCGAEALRYGVLARSRESSRSCVDIESGEAQSPAELQWQETLRTAMGGLCCHASRSWKADGTAVVAYGGTAGVRPCSPPSSSASTFTSSGSASSSSSASSTPSTPSSCCCCFTCWHDGADLLRRLDPEVDLVQTLLPLPSHAMSSCDPQNHWEEAKVVSEVVWDVALLLRRSPLTLPWTRTEAREGPRGSSPGPGGSIQPQPRPKPLCDPSADSALHQLLCFLLLWSPLAQGGADTGEELSARVLRRRQLRALQRHRDSVRSVLRRLAGLWVVSPPSNWSSLTVSSECLAWLFRRLMAVGELWTETDDMNDETGLQRTARGRGGPQWLNAHSSLWENSTDASGAAARRSNSNNGEEDQEQLVHHLQGAGVLSTLCTMLALLLRSVTKPVMRKKLYSRFLRCLPERPMVDAEAQPQWLGGLDGPPRAARTETAQVASAPVTTTRSAPRAGEAAFGRGGREGHADLFTSIWRSTAAESMSNAGTGTGTSIVQGAGKGSHTGTSTSTGTVTGATRSGGPSTASTALQSLPRVTRGSLNGQAVTSGGDASAPKSVCEPLFHSSAQLAAASAVLVTLCESLSHTGAEDARARQLLQSWGKKLASLPALALPSIRGCRVVARSGWVEGAQRVAQVRIATGEDFAGAAAPILQTLGQLLRSLRGEAETLREPGAARAAQSGAKWQAARGGDPSGGIRVSAGNAQAAEEAAELVEGCWTALAELLRDCAEARQRRPWGSTASPAGEVDCAVADGSGSTTQLQAVVAIAPLLVDCLLPEMSRLLSLPSVFSVLGLVRGAIELALPPLEDVEVSEERSAGERRLATMEAALSAAPASMQGPSSPSGPGPSGSKGIAEVPPAAAEPEDEFAMDSALEAALASVDVDAAVLEHLQLTQQPNTSPSTALHPPQHQQISRQRRDGRWEEAHQAAVLALSGLKAPLMKLLSRLYEPWSAVESFGGVPSRSRTVGDRSVSGLPGFVLPQEEASHSERASFEFCQPRAVVELEGRTLSALSGLLALGCYAAERAHCWAETATQLGCSRLSLWTAAQRRGLGEELPLRVFWALWELADRRGRLSLLRTPLPFLATPRAVPGSAESTAAPGGHYAVYLWVRAAMHYRLYGQVPCLFAGPRSGGASEGAAGHAARHSWRRLSHVVQRLLTPHHGMAAAVHEDLRLAAADVGSALEGGACGLPGCDLTCSGARLAAVEALLVATARRWRTLAHDRRSAAAQSLRLAWMDARAGLLAVAAGEVRQALRSLLAAWHRRRERAHRESRRPSAAHPSSGVSSSSASKGRVRRGEWLSAMEVREGVAAAVVHWLSLLGLLLRHTGTVGGGGGALGSNHFLRPILAEDCPAASHKGYTLSARYTALSSGGTTVAAPAEVLRGYAPRTADSRGATDGDAARQAEPSGAVTVDQRFEEAMTRLRRQREGFRGTRSATRGSHVGGGGSSEGRTSASGANTGGNGAEAGEGGGGVLWEIKGANFCSDLQVVLFPELMRYFAETADTYQLFGGGWARSHCRSFLRHLLQPPSFLGFGAYAPYLLGTEAAADQSVESELDSSNPEGAGRVLKSRVLGLALGRAVACGLICGSTCPATARALNTAVKTLLPPETGPAPPLYFSAACAADQVVWGSAEPTDSTRKTARCLNGCGWDLVYVNTAAGGCEDEVAHESEGECLRLSGGAPTRSQARAGVGLCTLCAACRRRRRLLAHLLGPGLGPFVNPSSVSHLLPALRLLHSLLQHASADPSCLRYILLAARELWQRLLIPQGALGVRRLVGPGARFARPLLACVSLVVACTELALPVLRPEEPAAATELPDDPRRASGAETAAAYVELPVLIAAAVARALRHSSAAAHGTEVEALVAAWRVRTNALAATTCYSAAWTEEGAEEASLESTQSSTTQSAAREAVDAGDGPAPDFLSDLILPVVEEVHGHQRDKQCVLDRCRSLVACIDSCGVQSWRDLAERFLRPSL